MICMSNNGTRTCVKCLVAYGDEHFAKFFCKARNKEYSEKRCRFCKNEAGRRIMAQKAASRKANNPSDATENMPTATVQVEEKIDLTPEQKERLEKTRITSRLNYEKNKSVILARAKEYRANNKDKINITRRKYLKEKMKDPMERLKRSMKTLLLAKIKKSASSTTYFGTDINFIKIWLEFNFSDEMTWENYGSMWHIDHTIPVHLWDLSKQEEVLMCFNWKNLMPLSAEMNLRKARHLQPARVFFQEQQLIKFEKQHTSSESTAHYIRQYALKLRTLLPELYMRHTSIAGTS
jgi:hypothetical protein